VRLSCRRPKLALGLAALQAKKKMMQNALLGNQGSEEMNKTMAGWLCCPPSPAAHWPGAHGGKPLEWRTSSCSMNLNTSDSRPRSTSCHHHVTGFDTMIPKVVKPFGREGKTWLLIGGAEPTRTILTDGVVNASTILTKRLINRYWVSPHSRLQLSLLWKWNSPYPVGIFLSPSVSFGFWRPIF